MDAASSHDGLLQGLPPGAVPPLVISLGIEGPGLLDALDRHAPGARLLALEPSPDHARQFIAGDEGRRWLESGRLTLLVGPHYEGRADAWKLVARHAAPPPVLVSPACEARAPEETEAAKAVARQIVLAAQSNENARKRLAGPYLVNTLANVPVISAEGDAAALTGLFDGLPAVLVGAGPSLDANLHALKKVADRAVVIAVDTAVRPLLAAGIHPQLVVGVDPSAANARHLAGLPDTRGMWLVAEGSLAPDVLPQFAGRTFIFRVAQHHPWPWLAARGHDRGRLDAWGSVLTTGMDLAARMGCNPIVFAGADLAYTDGVPYCRNTVYEPEWAHLTTKAARTAEFVPFFARQSTQFEPDIAGVPAMTAPRLVQFRDWIVTRANRDPSRRIVNATGAGVLHGGRIEQCALGALGLARPATGPAEWQERLHDAWRRSTAGRARHRALVSASLNHRDVPAELWLAECGESTTEAIIDAGIGAARAALNTLERRAAFQAMQREYYDSRIATLDDARRLSHGRYDAARRQSPARQAHVLLDYLQRAYPAKSGAATLDVVRAMTGVPKGLRALDVGCGVGRTMEPLVEAGLQVDGVDISERMIHFARQNAKLKGSRFFVSGGGDCGDAPDAAYDIVYSQICLQFLVSRTIRQDLFRAMARALRPGGVVVLHFKFFPDLDLGSIPAPHVPWSADAFDAAGAGGEVEVWPTPDELHLVYADVSRAFADVRLQVAEFPKGADGARHAQLIVSGATAPTLVDRLHPRP